MNFSNCDGKAQYMGLQQPKMKIFIIVNLYRPPQGNVVNFVNLLIDNINDITVKYPNAEITRSYRSYRYIESDFRFYKNENLRNIRWY